ncbi:MAG: hypothetical protein J5762_03945 [Clostridia bacterium]|nr:hypothetical protein [Clostridia bacterium]
MTYKSLPAADSYFMFLSGGTEYVGLSKNGVCYKVDTDGQMIPLRFCDELIPLYQGAVASRKRNRFHITGA